MTFGRSILASTAALVILALTACGKPSQNQPLAAPSDDATAASSSFGFNDTPDELTEALTRQIKFGSKVRIGRRNLDAARLREFYKLRNNQPLFVSALGPMQNASALANLLKEKSLSHGLLPADYWTQDMDSRWTRTDKNSLVELDLLLTSSFMQLAADIHTGRTNPQEREQEIYDIELKKRPFTDWAALNSMAATPYLLEAGLMALEPQHQAYKSLVQALARLQEARRLGGWPTLNFRNKVQRGASDKMIPAVRVRLYDLGLLQDPTERMNMSEIYDDRLFAAVVKFQTSMKLGSDGVLGKGTISELSTKIETRIDQVRANLERWRLLPRQLGEHYIFVDLNQQEFRLVRSGQVMMEMKVIVGKDQRQTPTFMDQMTAVIVNPYWYAPASIVIKDILPKAERDPGYFEQLHMRVFDDRGEVNPYRVDWDDYSLNRPPPYTFRQDPGDHNSLGRVKFNLSENRNSIYMHDTNHKELFQQQKRLFSSGCIRLEHPRALGAYLMGPQGIGASTLDAMIADPTVIHKTVKLNTPVRVYIIGQSIAVDPDGSVRFGRDFYEQDARVVAALNSRPIPGSAAKPQELEEDDRRPWDRREREERRPSRPPSLFPWFF